MKKLLLLDLDGTIRRPKSGAKFITNPDDRAAPLRDQEIIPESIAALKHFKDWICVGITNQGGVAAGYKSLSDAVAEQGKTMELLPQLKYIYFCPDFEGHKCYCVQQKEKLTQPYQDKKNWFRKPSPGMIHLALDRYAWSECLMIGDRSEDEQAALAAGINFMWVTEWWGQYAGS